MRPNNIHTIRNKLEMTKTPVQRHKKCKTDIQYTTRVKIGNFKINFYYYFIFCVFNLLLLLLVVVFVLQLTNNEKKGQIYEEKKANCCTLNDSIQNGKRIDLCATLSCWKYLGEEFLQCLLSLCCEWVQGLNISARAFKWVEMLNCLGYFDER